MRDGAWIPKAPLRFILAVGAVGIAAIVMAAIVIVATGVFAPANGRRPQRSATGARPTSTAAQLTAADARWASDTCTSILAWKQQLQHDATSLNLGFGPGARLQAATTATQRMLDTLSRIGPPPGAPTSQTRAQADSVRAAVTTQARDLQRVARQVAGGDILAVGTLISDLRRDRRMSGRLAAQLRQLVSTDLGLSLADTAACRRLVSIAV